MRFSSFRAATLSLLASWSFTCFTHAKVIIDWAPRPVSDGVGEFIFDGSELRESIGAVGNGDGTLAEINQTAGGLQFSTPYLIPGNIAGSVQNPATDSTTFDDVTLDLSGFAVSAPAVDLIAAIVQPLGAGAFELRGTDGTLLLSGVAASAAISRSAFDNTGLILSDSITYTGGAIRPFIAATPGSLSFSFIDDSPFASIGDNSYLTRFSADATGIFAGENGVPVPRVMWTGLIMISLLVVRRIVKVRRLAANPA